MLTRFGAGGRAGIGLNEPMMARRHSCWYVHLYDYVIMALLIVYDVMNGLLAGFVLLLWRSLSLFSRLLGLPVSMDF